MAVGFDEWLRLHRMTPYAFFQQAVERVLTVTGNEKTPPPIPPRVKKIWWKPVETINSALKSSLLDPEARPHDPVVQNAGDELRKTWSDIPMELRPKLAEWLVHILERRPMRTTMALDTFERGVLERDREDWVASLPKLRQSKTPPPIPEKA
jgi:hypothetical protein